MGLRTKIHSKNRFARVHIYLQTHKYEKPNEIKICQDLLNCEMGYSVIIGGGENFYFISVCQTILGTPSSQQHCCGKLTQHVVPADKSVIYHISR